VTQDHRLLMFPYFSPLQLVLAVVLAILAIIPSVIILRRMGYSGWWAILAAISPINIIGLWVLALIRWPSERHPAKP
jgi:ABC-type transport system involved in cytochrome bd biosynthesis fused ATPase/permease subunit